VTNTRTVSDSKRTFYTLHTRPINSIYRRVVDELMSEMHLLMVNTDYAYSPIYALGLVSAYDRLMTGYRPDADRESIFNALCKSVECEPESFRKDATDLLGSIDGLTWDGLMSGGTTGTLESAMAQVTGNPKFKYSRVFAIGVYTLLEKLDAEKLKDKEILNTALKTVAESLNLSVDKVQKDLELYRSNLEKMAAAQIVMADILAADRKKRDQREQEKIARAAAAAAPKPVVATEVPSETPAEETQNDVTAV
jgi:photosystem II biogenesis protein Psp29